VILADAAILDKALSAQISLKKVQALCPCLKLSMPQSNMACDRIAQPQQEMAG
jgi:hypothetical protein